MADTADTISLHWAELTECMETDSECGRVATTGKSEDKTETKDVRCKRVSDNDLRKKLNKNRGFGNEGELQATTSKSTSPTRSGGNKHTQRKPTNDLRMKLNRHRGETVRDSSDPQGEKRSPLDRYKYTERPGGLSPLRSPVNRSKQKTIFDIDNSRNFRFTKNRVTPSQMAAPSHDGENKDDHKCLRSPYRSEQHKSSVKSDDIDITPDREDSKTSLSDCDRDTPGHSLTPGQSSTPGHSSRQPWSRRKLHLPSEQNGSEDMPTERVPQAKEDDDLRLARRDKDIVYGKNTLAYQLYIEEVPVRERVMKVHPDTPDKFRKCSRRSWDSQVKIWKRKLHSLAADLKKNGELISDILHETHLQVGDSSSESKSDDEDFLDILDDDIFDLSDKGILTEDA